VDPVSRVICGVPVTVTDSEKFTCTEMESPAVYDPFAVDADTDDTVGAVVSMTSALFAASEFAAPGDAKVSVALLPAASAMVPPFNASEFVAT